MAGGLVAGSHTRNELHVLPGSDEVASSSLSLFLLLFVHFLRMWCLMACSNGLQPVSHRQKLAEFVAMRLDTKKMVSCLWRVMCAASPFVGLVMTMKGVKGTRIVLSATLATSAIRVISLSSHFNPIIITLRIFKWDSKHKVFLFSLPPGCPRVAGDDDENFDAEDFDEEFQMKNRYDDSDRQHVTVHSVIIISI
jgi:hypothetical protein